jgi:AraC-like DNA-binding protein
MHFEFGLYSSLLLPAFVHGIVFSILLFYRGYKNDRLSDRLLAWLLLLNSIKVAYWMLGFAGWYDTRDTYTSFMFYFPFNQVFWIGPLLYFYFLSLTNANFRFSKKDRVHFIIPVAWLLLCIAKCIVDYSFYHPFPVTEETQFGAKGPWAELDKNYWLLLAGYGSFFYYLLLTHKTFRSYKQYIKQNFSATEDIRFNWLQSLLYAVATGVLLMFIFQVISNLRPGGNSFRFEWYAYFGLGITIYYLGIAGYFTPTRQVDRLQFSPEVLPEKPVKEDTNQWEDWKQKLAACMQTEEPYLEPELNLAGLAKRLKTNPGILSKVINEGMGQNFNDYINEFRVKAVIKKLEEGEQLRQTLLGIAYDCGFNSKATFNRSFKKITGFAPKDYTNRPKS